MAGPSRAILLSFLMKAFIAFAGHTFVGRSRGLPCLPRCLGLRPEKCGHPKCALCPVRCPRAGISERLTGYVYMRRAPDPEGFGIGAPNKNVSLTNRSP